MKQTPDTLPLIGNDWLIEGQRFLNQRFGDELQFPIYVIRAPTTDDNVFMTIAGGADSLHYRDEITDWQGGGYLIRLHKNRSSRIAFNTAILHEASHAFQPIFSTPLPHPIAGMEIPASPETRGPSSVYWQHRFHKADFWRIAFHVLKRATLAGFECDHKKLGIIWVDLDAMRDALEDETLELLDMPLWKIARRPVPRRFQQLFDIDLSTINQSNSPFSRTEES